MAEEKEAPSRRPDVGPHPVEGDEFFEKLSRGARKAYGDGGGGASGEQGEAD